MCANVSCLVSSRLVLQIVFYILLRANLVYASNTCQSDSHIPLLLACGRRERTGLFQRFIPPLGPHNSAIRSIYTSKKCLLEQRKNKYNLHDTRFGLYERAITFEGPPGVLRGPIPLRGTVLANQIQSLCNEVVDQVQNMTAKLSSTS